MDLFTIILYVIGAVLFVSAIAAIISHLRFQEKNQRLPDACKFQNLSERIQNQKEEMQKMENEINRLKEEHRELLGNIEKAENAKDWLNNNQNTLNELEAKLKQVALAKAEYDEYLRIINELIPKIESQEKENVRLGAEIASKKAQLDDLKTQKDSIEKQIKIDKATADELSAQIAVLEAKINDLKDELKSLKEDYDKLVKEYQEKDEELSKLKTDILINRSIKERLERENNALKKDNEALNKEKKDLETANASLRKENAILNKENESLNKKNHDLGEEIKKLEEKRNAIEKDYNDKKNFIASYEGMKNGLESEIKSYENQIEELKEIIKILEEQIKRLHGNSEEKLKDLWEPIAFPKLAPSTKEKNEIELLEETKEYIRGKKLYFPDRVLRAFHTSLKCNDISPITVLAGISGTGKSELPKCYAEGMGIHFSMLAVQPRWDSSQDLLGFYNYMENKYKATELARALVRFDRYNRESWGKVPETCDDRSDRMLLVLLDEMNLARVEYYFSEFLSKLETRRGVNPKDPKDRVKAEIELELTGHAPLHIFADRNVLFTGTMNEDESTQTLSDKVLDRANVLRFGKPKSADIAKQLNNSKYRDPREEGLTYLTWSKWCKNAKDITMDSDVTGWINQLNNAMEKLQKPFGHRVAQAIATYIANYPEIDGTGKKLAFADQIEQRIMPKLRGIDLEIYDEPLKAIGDLIADTGDDALYSAYETGRQENNYGVFLWQGIDRSEEY